MNLIWLVMMAASIAVMIFNDPGGVLPALSESASGAIATCFSMLGVYIVWLGIFAILDAAKFNRVLARILHPVIRLLYGNLPPLTEEYISLNMSANILGLCGAATPMGIRALGALDDGTGRASDAAVMLVVVNSTSIQLLPTTLIGIRAAAGSIHAADIILPSLITSAITFVLAVLLCKLCASLSKKMARKKKEPAPLPLQKREDAEC